MDNAPHRSRPVEEEVIKMPFGNYDLAHENVGYDGQDTWEDVSVGGSASNPQDQPGGIDYDDMRDRGKPGSHVDSHLHRDWDKPGVITDDVPVIYPDESTRHDGEGRGRSHR